MCPIMQVQLDNYTKNKKKICVCLLVFTSCERNCQGVVYIFLLVGHTHSDIDATFGQWSMNLHEDFSTILLLIIFYIDLHIVPITHMLFKKCQIS